MNNIILRYFDNINMIEEIEGDLLNEGVLMNTDIEEIVLEDENEINIEIEDIILDSENENNVLDESIPNVEEIQWDIQEVRIKCICRYNNNFNLCNRNIIDDSLYCRYHKNTKIHHIHKIFYDVFKEKIEITKNDLYLLYRYINNVENSSNIKGLYIELLKNIPFKILLNVAEGLYIISGNRKYSKTEIYNILYNINKKTFDIEKDKTSIKRINKLYDRIREKLKGDLKNKLKDNIIVKYDIEDNYMNDEEVFTGENICDISVNRLYVLKNGRNEKYVFDAVELEYFIRKCVENKQEPYNPYNRDKLDDNTIKNIKLFIKYKGLLIKTDEYLWENNMHAFTELSLEIESKGFYNSPEWFNKLKDADFLKIIKYFKLFSSNIPESNKYFNDIRADTLVYDFCKDAIKMFKECNDEYYILCCNFIKAMALCSNNFFNNMPSWLLGNNGDNVRVNTNLENLMGLINSNNATELANNFLLYYYVEYI